MHGYVSLDGGEAPDGGAPDLEAGGSGCGNKDGCTTLTGGKGGGTADGGESSSNTDSLLYPGISAVENQHRWGFIRKVYGIVASQIVLNTVVSGVVALYGGPFLRRIIEESDIRLVLAVCFLPPLISILLLFCYRRTHPLNLWLLGLFTVSLSLPVTVVCNFAGTVMLQGLLLTSAVVLSLIAYTFWAVKMGKDLNLLALLLITGLVILTVNIVIMISFPSVSMWEAFQSGLYTLLFSLYLVLDTYRLIKIFDYDEYVWASVVLYTDIFYIFMYITQLLSYLSGGS